MKIVTKIPNIEDIELGDTFEININKVSYFTHSFFKYPCKFIPHIPNWCIENFSKKNDYVLDCFAGSGTTLVQSSLLERYPLGIDFDKFSILLSKVKTTQLNKDDINEIKSVLPNLFNEGKQNPLPKLNNLTHWFSNRNIKDLNTLYHNINNLSIDEKNKNFLKVCFASIIRKCSYSDEVSPKPYISSKIKKEPKNVFSTFSNVSNKYLNTFSSDKYTLKNQITFIGEDARVVDSKKYLGKIKLICTSPPYINAFDYVRILRLENIWLRNMDDTDIKGHKEKQIGTEQIYSTQYNEIPQKTNLKLLDNKINQLYKIDKKRAHIVLKYFLDMELNMKSMKRYLIQDGYYILVVGDCRIRNINFPIYKYLIEFSKLQGYTLINYFSYLIKNPYLRIPRKNRGGLIKYDRIIILKK